MKSIHSNAYKHLLALLIECRTLKGVTQQQLSQKLNRPQSYVSKYERGERRLDVIEFLEICRLLETDPYELLRTIENSPIP